MLTKANVATRIREELHEYKMELISLQIEELSFTTLKAKVTVQIGNVEKLINAGYTIDYTGTNFARLSKVIERDEVVKITSYQEIWTALIEDFENRKIAVSSMDIAYDKVRVTVKNKYVPELLALGYTLDYTRKYISRFSKIIEE